MMTETEKATECMFSRRGQSHTYPYRLPMSDTDILSKRRGRYGNHRVICGCCVCPGLFYFLAKNQKYHSPSCNRSKGYAYGTDKLLEFVGVRASPMLCCALFLCFRGVCSARVFSFGHAFLCSDGDLDIERSRDYDSQRITESY